MIIIEYTKTLNQSYYNDLKNLLDKYDESFVPPLSYRESTTQIELNNNGISTSNKNSKKLNIDKYFDNLLKQSFLLAIKNDRIIGFMSFVERETIIYGSMNESNYVSTVIVDESARGKGLTKKFYKELSTFNSPITTRTWSTNYAHISILNSLGFNVVKAIKNDRGVNIDTLYFEKL